MEIISRFIVFLWLFPVTIFIIIPLLILLVRTLGYMFKKNTRAKALIRQDSVKIHLNHATGLCT